MDNIRNQNSDKLPSNEGTARHEPDNELRSPFAMILLAVALLFGVGNGVYSYYLHNETTLAQNNMMNTLSSQGESIQKLSQQMADSSENFANLSKEVSSTKDHLGSTQGELNKTKQIANLLGKQQKESAEQLTGQLGQLQQDQATTKGTVGNLASDVSGVKTDVSGVKQDVNSTKEQLASTQNDLKRVVGDMGVQSDLIAHNGQELAELKLLGERDYQEFDIRKSNQPQRLGNIAIALRKTDMKRQKFTINLIVDDRTIEKKEKNVNEPVQFYQNGYRQPTEIVANQIYKDRIVGYVSVPKKKEARTTASAVLSEKAGL